MLHMLLIDNHSAAHLVQSARQAVEMYRAVIPAVNRRYFKQVPHFSALYHNDCLYLSNVLLTLRAQYEPRYVFIS